MMMTMNVLARRLAIALTVLGTLAASSLANAAETKRVGVLKFHGPAEGATRNAVSRAAKANKFQVVGAKQIDKIAKKLGVKMNDNDSFTSVAKELGLTAFVVGEVTKKKATLTIRSGADGSVGAEASWSGPNPRKLAGAVEKTFWRRLGGAIERSKPPSGAKKAVVAEEEAAPESAADEAGGDKDEKEAPAKTSSSGTSKSDSNDKEEDSSEKKKAAKNDDGEESKDTAKAESAEEGGGGDVEAMDVALHLGNLMRSFSYNNNLSKDSTYSLPAGPLVGGAGEIYPGALLGLSGIGANIGVTGGVSLLVPGTVTSPSKFVSGKYATDSMSISAGLKVRLPAGLFVTAGWGSQWFKLTWSGAQRQDEETNHAVPFTAYTYGRIGGGGRWHLNHDWSLMVNAGFLQVLSTGELKTKFFPKVTGAAIEAGISAGYRIFSSFEIRAGVDLRRYGFNFHQTVADAGALHVAGGAIDQYTTIWGGLAWVLGGGSSHASSGDDEPAKESSEKAEKSEDDAEAKSGKSDGKSGDDADEKPTKKKSLHDDD